MRRFFYLNRYFAAFPKATIRRRRHHGATLMELLVVISIITTLAVLGASIYNPTRQRLYEAECQQQLADIQLAVVRYREEHRQQDPQNLMALVPQYLPEKALVCPFTRARAPQAVAIAQQVRQKTPLKYWASYFWFSRRGLDRLYAKGNLPFSYSQVLQKRGGETPLVACFDHREPYSFDQFRMGTVEALTTWYHPERPVLVLRQHGRVSGAHYGSLKADGMQADTLAYLLNL